MSKDMLKEIEANHQLSCENENDARYVWPSRWKEVRILVDNLLDIVRDLEQKTYCAYCGKEYPIDSDGSEIAEHIRMCEKHPLGIENARLRETLEFYADAENWKLLVQYGTECEENMDCTVGGAVFKDKGERARKTLKEEVICIDTLQYQ